MIVCISLAIGLIWPPPRTVVASGPPLHLAHAVNIEFAHAPDRILTPRLLRIVDRFSELLSNLTAKGNVNSPILSQVIVEVPMFHDERLTEHTCYNYTLNISTSVARVASCSVFGVAYGLEGLVQLAGTGGRLPHDTVLIEDAPAHSWRGLMIDSGRRFFPVALVENLIDTMAAVKLNVLHLHASDHCRWGVESRLYPELTKSLTGIRAGHYTQDDIRRLVEYAHDRGIRVVPEFDVPGHARGMLPLEETGDVQFCTDAPTRSQLFDDPTRRTYTTVAALVREMAQLFPDEVFHIGCDETRTAGSCALNTTFTFERRLAEYVASDLGKTAEGWEEILFSAAAATNRTVVNAWSRHRPPEITATGRKAVESFSAHFYFTRPAAGGPEGWAPCWYDISTGIPSSELPLLLGGEMSMCAFAQKTACPKDPMPTSDGKPLEM